MEDTVLRCMRRNTGQQSRWKERVLHKKQNQPKGVQQKVSLAQFLRGQAGGWAGGGAFQHAARASGRIFLEGLGSGRNLGGPWLRA